MVRFQSIERKSFYFHDLFLPFSVSLHLSNKIKQNKTENHNTHVTAFKRPLKTLHIRCASRFTFTFFPLFLPSIHPYTCCNKSQSIFGSIVSLLNSFHVCIFCIPFLMICNGILDACYAIFTQI